MATLPLLHRDGREMLATTNVLVVGFGVLFDTILGEELASVVSALVDSSVASVSASVFASVPISTSFNKSSSTSLLFLLFQDPRKLNRFVSFVFFSTRVAVDVVSPVSFM